MKRIFAFVPLLLLISCVSPIAETQPSIEPVKTSEDDLSTDESPSVQLFHNLTHSWFECDGNLYGPFDGNFLYGPAKAWLINTTCVYAIHEDDRWNLYIGDTLYYSFDSQIVGTGLPSGVSYVGRIGDHFVVNGVQDGRYVLFVDDERMPFEDAFAIHDVDGSIFYSARNDTRHFCVLNDTVVVESGGWAFARVENDSLYCDTRDLGRCVVGSDVECEVIESENFTKECHAMARDRLNAVFNIKTYDLIIDRIRCEKIADNDFMNDDYFQLEVQGMTDDNQSFYAHLGWGFEDNASVFGSGCLIVGGEKLVSHTTYMTKSIPYRYNKTDDAPCHWITLNDDRTVASV